VEQAQLLPCTHFIDQQKNDLNSHPTNIHAPLDLELKAEKEDRLLKVLLAYA